MCRAFLSAWEGAEWRWARHSRIAGGLRAGVLAMGLEMLPEDSWWLPSLNAVRVPEGIDAKQVTATLLARHGIEISGGFGPLAGRIFRIGCMGHSCRPANVLALLPALAEALREQRFEPELNAGLAAAAEAMGA